MPSSPDLKHTIQASDSIVSEQAVRSFVSPSMIALLLLSLTFDSQNYRLASMKNVLNYSWTFVASEKEIPSSLVPSLMTIKCKITTKPLLGLSNPQKNED